MPRRRKRPRRPDPGSPKRLIDMTEPELQAMMEAAARGVLAAIPPRTGFVVLAFEFGPGGVAQYIANAQRADMVRMLRETADRLDGREEIGRVEFDP